VAVGSRVQEATPAMIVSGDDAARVRAFAGVG
jgi:hypothetical protein